jgi:hypothetical protein
MTADRGTVRRRHLLYVSGFDPKGARFYHGLYRREAAARAALDHADGLEIEVGPRRRGSQDFPEWQVEWRRPGEPVVVNTHRFLSWDAIVRAHWNAGRSALWRATLRGSGRSIVGGSWRRALALSWPVALAMLLPAIVRLAMLAAPLAGLALALAGSPLAGLALAAGLLAAAQWSKRRFDIDWVARTHDFVTRLAAGEVADLDPVLDRMAQALEASLEAALDGDADEVLVVGHSAGTIVSTLLMARIASRAPDPRLALLHLGQCLPLGALLDEAVPLRAAMARLADLPTCWVDYSSPADGCIFPLVDSLADCGVRAPGDRAVRFKRLNPRFAASRSAAAYRALRRDPLALHFAYLTCPETLDDYDWFAISAGPLTLAARTADCPSVDDFTRLRTGRADPPAFSPAPAPAHALDSASPALQGA